MTGFSSIGGLIPPQTYGVSCLSSAPVSSKPSVHYNQTASSSSSVASSQEAPSGCICEAFNYIINFILHVWDWILDCFGWGAAEEVGPGITPLPGPPPFEEYDGSDWLGDLIQRQKNLPEVFEEGPSSSLPLPLPDEVFQHVLGYIEFFQLLEMNLVSKKIYTLLDPFLLLSACKSRKDHNWCARHLYRNFIVLSLNPPLRTELKVLRAFFSNLEMQKKIFPRLCYWHPPLGPRPILHYLLLALPNTLTQLYLPGSFTDFLEGSKFPQLNTLFVGNPDCRHTHPYLGPNDHEVTAEGFNAGLSHLTGLTMLTTPWATHMNLRNFTQLTSLNILDATDECALQLTCLTKLSHLALRFCTLTAQGCEALPTLPSLVSLKWVCSSTLLQETGLDSVRKCTNLTFLDLSGNFLRDASVQKLTNLTRLRFLDLTSNCLTSVSFSHYLPKLSLLEELYVAGSGTKPFLPPTLEEKQALRQALPFLRVLQTD